jgi:hypothetical protein
LKEAIFAGDAALFGGNLLHHLLFIIFSMFFTPMLQKYAETCCIGHFLIWKLERRRPLASIF